MIAIPTKRPTGAGGVSVPRTIANRDLIAVSGLPEHDLGALCLAVAA
jgi:hypothetical protein